jgi:hypothetical protein
MCGEEKLPAPGFPLPALECGGNGALADHGSKQPAGSWRLEAES